MAPPSLCESVSDTLHRVGRHLFVLRGGRVRFEPGLLQRLGGFDMDGGQICHCVSRKFASISPSFVVSETEFLQREMPVFLVNCYLIVC
jgi:hypothetical protein